MNAVDTNVLAHFLMGDDADQLARATSIISGGAWIASTVALELEWVLRGYYRLNGEQVATAFRSLMRLPSVRFEHPQRISKALDGLADRMDFADAFHLAGAEGQDGFATFDKNLVRSANRLPGVRAFEP